MRWSIILGCMTTLFLAGCANTRQTASSTGADFTNQSHVTTTGSYSSATSSDSTHPGGTWKEERDATKRQINLVTLALFVGALIVLALTLGTAGRGG